MKKQPSRKTPKKKGQVRVNHSKKILNGKRVGGAH